MRLINRLLLIPAAIVMAAGMCCCKCDGGTASEDPFEKAFNDPPESTKPWVYWYWISDNISKEGITRDLEAMAEVGIGEALIGNVVDPDVKTGSVKVLSDEWWGCVEHAVSEADRLGIKVGMFNCPGWSQSGGPWVKPEQAMRYLASSELRVKGPQKISRKLETPTKFFQQVKVQAFPVPALDSDMLKANSGTITTGNFTTGSLDKMLDDNLATFGTTMNNSSMIRWKLKEPRTMRSVEIFPAGPIKSSFVLSAKDDKGEWVEVASRAIERQNLGAAIGPLKFGAVCETFPPVTSTEFMIQFPGISAGSKISEIRLSGAARLSHFVEKQLGKMSPIPEIYADTYMWHPSAEPGDNSLVVAGSKVIDVTANVDADGVITWDVPEGEWIILRTGMGLTGTQNAPTTDQGRGYEIDKMSKKIAGEHFDAFIGEFLKRVPADKRRGFRHVVADSYEQGSENWTEGFAEHFQEVYGYDPYPFFPVLTGRIVESADRSDRFLWDMRRLVADRIASDYVGGLREKCEQNGLRLWLENYGHWGFPGEFLSYGGASDDLGGEFWLSQPTLGPIEVRCASSAGHTYGKQVVSAEAFTSNWTFNKMPRDLKIRGDWSWTEGINHFVLHVYIHQPDERKPGMSAWFGTDFNRYSTWFFAAKSWFDYVRRSCAVMQTGSHVADVAYFIGEDTPKMTGDRDPELPRGYDYDFINADVLLNDAKVESGRIVLSSGASYAILVLPPQATMRPEVLDRIAQMVNDGATILGAAPERSPSGKNYPECDDQVRNLAVEVWGSVDGKGVTEGIYGKGRVFSGIDLAEAFSRMGIGPDIAVPEGFLFTHRRAEGSDAYFVSNQQEADRNETIAFRVKGKQPELWNPVTGEKRTLTDYRVEGDMTYVPLEFGGGDSWFVVFRKAGKAKGNGKPNFPRYEEIRELTGEWTVAFDPAYDAPASTVFPSLTDWSANADPSIKYYGGTARYAKTFDYDGSGKEPVFLDLGRVETMATVRLNGEELATLWRYPYRVELTGALRKGENDLEVEVINSWWNRLVGDKQPGAKSYTWSAYVGWNADTPLLPSGLLGPVRLEKKI